MLGDVNKPFVFKSLLTTPSNDLPLRLKQAFPPMIWAFTEGKDDEIESLYFDIYMNNTAIWSSSCPERGTKLAKYCILWIDIVQRGGFLVLKLCENFQRPKLMPNIWRLCTMSIQKVQYCLLSMLIFGLKSIWFCIPSWKLNNPYYHNE